MVDFGTILARAWPILIEAARMRRTISYSELAGRAGPPLTARAVHKQLLNPLSARCRAVGLPDLSALVVRKSSGFPGGGWFDPERPGDPDLLRIWAEATLLCYDHRWTARPDPRLTKLDRRPKSG